MTTDNIVIYYNYESKRPPFYTTRANLSTQEKMFSSIIREVVSLDENGKEIKPDYSSMSGWNTPRKDFSNVNPYSEKVMETIKHPNPQFITTPVSKDAPMTDHDLAKLLFKRGKSIKSISTYLNIPIKEIEFITGVPISITNETK